jgi:hypothetical protein
VHRLQAGEVAPQPAAHRAQRSAHPPDEAQPLAGRDLATADGGEYPLQRRGDFRRGTQAGKVDVEPLAGVWLAGRRRQDEPQHRQPQIALALDERGQGAGPGLPQQQPERATARVADAARPALRIAGLPLGKPASGVPGRVPGRVALGVLRARTRARRNRIRTK